MKALPGSLLILSEIYLRPNLIVPIPTKLNTTQYIIHYIIYYCRPLPPDRYRALQSKQGKNYYDGFSTTPSSILTYGFVPLKTIRPQSSSLLVHTDQFSPITVWFIFDQSYSVKMHPCGHLFQFDCHCYLQDCKVLCRNILAYLDFEYCAHGYSLDVCCLFVCLIQGSGLKSIFPYPYGISSA